MWAGFDIMKIWQTKIDKVQGVAFDCGHFLPEENPKKTAEELIKFLDTLK